MKWYLLREMIIRKISCPMYLLNILGLAAYLTQKVQKHEMT